MKIDPIFFRRILPLEGRDLKEGDQKRTKQVSAA
jgi:hypothetical protein